MPIKEQSFRIGCGRYLQGEGMLAKCGEEVCRLGNSPLIVGGATALSVSRDQIEKSVSDACAHYKIYEYRGTCNDDDAKALASLAKNEGYDVIVGVGGGVIMDFSKLIGHFAALPVINVPTSSATCAAYTPLSVRYTADGRTVGSLHYEREVNAVIADTAVLSAQPTRLLLAGVFDALAKFVEIKHRFAEGADNSDCPLGLDWAFVLSEYSYRELFAKVETCLGDMARGEVSDCIEKVTFTLIAATGVISGIARGSNQTALAHKFYEVTRSLYPEESRAYLHGEIVGIGLLIQNDFNGERGESDELLGLMKKYGMPHRLSDIGVAPTAETLEAYFAALKKSSAVLEGGDSAESKLRASLEYLWELG